MSFISLKHGEVFLVTNEYGDIDSNSIGTGLYFRDTCFLNKYKMKINDTTPIHLATIKKKGINHIIILSNGDVETADAYYEKMDLEIRRLQLVYAYTFYDHIIIKNGSQKTTSFQLTFELATSFDDLFEMRGARRIRKGEFLPIIMQENKLLYTYRGLDGITRTLIVEASKEALVKENQVTYNITLKPGEQKVIDLAFQPVINGKMRPVLPYEKAKRAAESELMTWLQDNTLIITDNPAINKTIEQAMLDLYMLSTDIGYGSFLVAGIPWFCVPFGRDSIISAYQTLILNPKLAKNTLRTLAVVQGTKEDAFSDEMPGKILHEMRFGEMANLNEVPFSRYYGSVDSTPLFLILLSETFHWTGDLDFLKEMMPYAEKALDYLENFADLDGDGYIEFHKQSENGLDIQSWKDSKYSMVHADGTLSESPMAVVEVQGYIYDAKMRMAQLYYHLGNYEKSQMLIKRAEALKQRFNQDFWMEEKGFFALALDRNKKQVSTITSNPGHCLWSGIIEEGKAQQVADMLLSEGLFSGWGIRTMSKKEKVYSPLSYHNGTVWPHDNSLIALGLSKYGFKEHLNKLVKSLFEAAMHFTDHRLPELFCGYDRDEVPLVPYPVACSPQAWAAGAPFACVQALLGIRVDGIEKTVTISPTLPDDVNYLQLKGLKIGNGIIDLAVVRSKGRITIELNKNTSGYKVIISSN